MAFETWEQRAFDELSELYTTFFERISEYGKACYRIDAHKIFSKHIKELPKEQEKKIMDYWKMFTSDFDIAYHKYYIDKAGEFDVRFIPDDLFVGYIDGYLNNRTIEPGIADKNYFDMYLKGFKMPKTFVHLINGIYEDENYNIISKEKALEILSKQKKITVKPSMASYGGKNVTFLEELNSKEILEFLNNLSCQNLIFQETIVQSNETAKLHTKSLNTIRIMTLILDNDVKVLSSVFRMGVGESKVDNASSGGIYCKINEDGTLSNIAYDALGNKYDKHPDGGEFKKVKFDFMNNVKKIVKLAAQRLPHFRLIGWDIAINQKKEPVIIEANLTMSSIDLVQTVDGPLFGEYTGKILEEVFLKKHNENICMDISQYI